MNVTYATDGQFVWTLGGRVKDAQFVFYGAVTLPKARVEHWSKIGDHYSRDDLRVYYLNRQIKEADHASFEIVQSPIPRIGFLLLAKDKNHYYRHDRIVDQATFEEDLRNEFR